MSELTDVVVGVVFNTEGHILVALRPSNKSYAGFWEFPGGKIEKNETPHQALARELLEEVDIVPITYQFLVTCKHHYHYSTVRLRAYKIMQFKGTAYGKEGQHIRWVLPEELTQLDLLSANQPIVSAILKK